VCSNCILKHVTDVKIKGKKLREDEEEDVNTYWMKLGREKCGYCKLEKRAPDGTLEN
jgi:hypothetical protein